MTYPHAIVDTQIQIEGNRLVSRDVFSDGSLSCLKGDLGTYKTPEHAEIMAYLYAEPMMLIWASEGKLTQELIDKMAAELRQRRLDGARQEET